MMPSRAAASTLMVGSFLLWLYCICRIFLNRVVFDDPFIIGIPGSFLEISIGSFIIFLAALFSYLVLGELDREM